MFEELLVYDREDGKVGMMNAWAEARTEVQKAFRGTADELRIKEAQSVVDMVKEVRAERHNDSQANP